jgi:outer membrane protein OmpA-like peptidoglycan-associated protein
VVAALRERGLSINITSAGRGESEPLCTEETDECHEQNRRVDFVVETVAR